jgi:hypothetical protein
VRCTGYGVCAAGLLSQAEAEPRRERRAFAWSDCCVTTRIHARLLTSCPDCGSATATRTAWVAASGSLVGLLTGSARRSGCRWPRPPDCVARAVEPDTAQPCRFSSQRIDLKLVTDVDRSAGWYAEGGCRPTQELLHQAWPGQVGQRSARRRGNRRGSRAGAAGP